jgi:glucose/mannose-6-phosphate isomerase
MSKIDKYNFKTIIQKSHEQFSYGIKLAQKIKIKDQGFDSIVVCGLGGSQMPGYFLNSCFNSKVPVFNHNNYGVPEKLTKKPLFLISSFSGNTEETIDSYLTAKQKGFRRILFSNGGKLEELAKKNQEIYLNYQINDPNFQPRCATPMTTAAMATVLENSKLLVNGQADLVKTAKLLKKETEKTTQVIGKKLAHKIKDRTAVFYASYDYKTLAMILKIKINENAKFLAYWNYYPELNHNEMNGYQNDRPKRFLIINIDDNEAKNKKNLKRAQITQKLLQKRGYKVETFSLKGQTRLQKSFYGFIVGEWISYYLAIKNNQDPTPVEMVEEFKKML